MRVTLPGVAISAIIGAYVVLGLDKAGVLHLRQPPAEQSKNAAQAPQTGGPRPAPQSAGIEPNTGGGRQTNPATALAQPQQQKPAENGGKVPEQGPVRSKTGSEPAGAPPKPGVTPPPAQTAASAPPPAPARQ
jgi:hypothetical protein